MNWVDIFNNWISYQIWSKWIRLKCVVLLINLNSETERNDKFCCNRIKINPNTPLTYLTRKSSFIAMHKSYHCSAPSSKLTHWSVFVSFLLIALAIIITDSTQSDLNRLKLMQPFSERAKSFVIVNLQCKLNFKISILKSLFTAPTREKDIIL